MGKICNAIQFLVESVNKVNKGPFLQKRLAQGKSSQPKSLSHTIEPKLNISSLHWGCSQTERNREKMSNDFKQH